MASLFFVLGGIFMLMASIWWDALNQRLGLRRPIELLTSERLKRSAQLEERLGRIIQALLGLGLLIQGIILSSLDSPILAVARSIILLLLIGCLLGLFATKIYYWRG